VTAVSGQDPHVTPASTTPIRPAKTLYSWPIPPNTIPSPGSLEPPRPSATSRIEPFTPHFSGGPYHQIEVRIERKEKTFWCYLQPEDVPSFTHGILRELADMQRAIKRMFADHAGQSDAPVRHFVVASRLPGIFNMGGDLAFFADRIRAQDRQALLTYAHACIEVVYNNATALDLPMITMALVQGDALGGGFEAALSCDLIIAERSAKMGLPEILFNLFPGMGAYSLLSRKLDPARAERMILSGRIYGAAELYEMGLVDVVAEDGQGEEAVRHYIARNARRHGVQRCLSEMRRRINPLTFAELQDVTEMWVETALRLEEIDLRKMERLMTAQRRRVASRVNGAALAVGT